MKYSNEEKLSIITRYQQGESAIALSNELAIPRSTLYRWFNSFPADSSGNPLKFSYQEYALLQRKVEKLQNIITILKSVDCLVSAPLKERLHALEPFYGKYKVHTICEALEVDRGTFYNHMLRSKRGNAWFDKRRQEYCQLIRDVFDEYRQVLGAEKIRTILVQRGYQVSAEYVSRLMREMGLSSVRSTAKQEYLKLREPERKKNILRQQFNAQRPNQRWVSDVTCFKLGDHYFYICVIIDLFSRKVIAHKVSKKNFSLQHLKWHMKNAIPHLVLFFIATMERNIPLTGFNSFCINTIRSNPFLSPASRMITRSQNHSSHR